MRSRSCRCVSHHLRRTRAAAAPQPRRRISLWSLVLQGWDQPLPSKQYSGFIHVEDGPGGQDIYMHYNFIESQGSPKSDPLTLWQQGGPGSSGFGFGYMAELGPFHLSAESMAGAGEGGVPKLWRNEYSWDALSNILILEHPPGTGFSYCAAKNGTAVPCKWNDETQAEAFLMELQGWFELFPEYAEHDFYLTGESYAGLLLPNLMHQIATKPNKINLKAAAIGNGCTGTPGQSVENPGTCNLGGDFDEQHNVDLFYGHGMLASKDYHAIYKNCNFTCGPELKACHAETRSHACQQAMQAMDRVGSYNIYNIYDVSTLQVCIFGSSRESKSQLLRRYMVVDSVTAHTLAQLRALTGLILSDGLRPVAMVT